MNSFANEAQADWPTLLDELKQLEGISSDAKLAATLGITRGYICSVRKGRQGLSLKLAKEIFSRLGRGFDTDNLERLFVPVRVQIHTRNLAAIRDYVVQRAAGHCQLCGCEAPFKDRRGLPFLEAHHVVPFHDGGTDTPDNLVALCPNCHRKLEVSAAAVDQQKLQKIVAKYQKP